MATLEAAIAAIQTSIASISGIRSAPALPPEKMTAGVFPFVVAYPDTGTVEVNTPGEMKFLHNIVIEIHVARKDLPRDVDTLYPYAESVPNKIFTDVTFGGAIQTFGALSYTFGVLNWGDGDTAIQTIGFRWTMEDVKILYIVT